MRIAIISDIHGNLKAFQRMLSRVDNYRPETVVCLGDIVGYGPYPNECVDLVRERCTITIKGNHDAGAIGEIPLEHFSTEGKAAILWTRDRLTPSNEEYLKALPVISVFQDVTFVHASPHNPESWAYVATWRDAAQVFPHFITPYCCIGHTHIPAIVAEDGTVNDFQPGKRHLINCGSIGQPRDGNPRLSFAVLDTDVPSAEIVRVEYDVNSTASAIRAAGLPEFLARRLVHGI
jgi:predicted phosphodiesterase